MKSKESMQSGNRCEREKEEGEGFVINAAEPMSKKSQRNGTSVSLKTLSENFVMDEIFKNIFDEELNKL